MTIPTEQGSESVRCNVCDGPLTIEQETDGTGVFTTKPCPTCAKDGVAPAPKKAAPAVTEQAAAPAVVETEKGS